MKYLILVVIVAVMSGCANRPGSIPASYVSHERYAGADCTNLAQQKMEAISKLMVVSDKQNGLANADAIGVFLIGVPVSKLSGDHEADVAFHKGEIQAIETAQITQNCGHTRYVFKTKEIKVDDNNTSTTESFLN